VSKVSEKEIIGSLIQLYGMKGEGPYSMGDIYYATNGDVTKARKPASHLKRVHKKKYRSKYEAIFDYEAIKKGVQEDIVKRGEEMEKEIIKAIKPFMKIKPKYKFYPFDQPTPPLVYAMKNRAIIWEGCDEETGQATVRIYVCTKLNFGSDADWSLFFALLKPEIKSGKSGGYAKHLGHESEGKHKVYEFNYFPVPEKTHPYNYKQAIKEASRIEYLLLNSIPIGEHYKNSSTDERAYIMKALENGSLDASKYTMSTFKESKRWNILEF